MGERVLLEELRADFEHRAAPSVACLAGAAYLRYAGRLVFFYRLAYTSVYATPKGAAHAAQGEDLHE